MIKIDCVLLRFRGEIPITLAILRNGQNTSRHLNGGVWELTGSGGEVAFTPPVATSPSLVVFVYTALSVCLHMPSFLSVTSHFLF